MSDWPPNKPARKDCPFCDGVSGKTMRPHEGGGTVTERCPCTDFAPTHNEYEDRPDVDANVRPLRRWAVHLTCAERDALGHLINAFEAAGSEHELYEIFGERFALMVGSAQSAMLRAKSKLIEPGLLRDT